MSAPVRTDVDLGERTYPVLVGEGSLAELDAHVVLPGRASRALVVTQAPVIAAGHLAPVEDALTRAGLEVTRHEVPATEAAKDPAVLAELWRACAQVPLTRDDVVVGVGGGVVGDLAGFAGATYARGIAVLQVPTTLLAQVDAAIGGKTGIDLPEGKNLVGAFHQPLAVACDVATLATLDRRVRVEGLGEVVKYGLIRDPVILEILEADPGAATDGPASALAELVARSVAVKAAVVAADEREGGERAHLNLGHTFGHALETLSRGGLLHGEAVAVGTLVALHLGVALGRTPPALLERTEILLERLGLPTRAPALDRDAVWATMARDKKADRDGVRFVILDDLARPALVTPERAEVDAAIDAVTQP